VALNLSNATAQRGLITNWRSGFSAFARDCSTQQPTEKTGNKTFEHRPPRHATAKRTREVVEAPFFQCAPKSPGNRRALFTK
jgi:hypothetical protein